MSNPKDEFYRTINEIVGSERLTDEEAYIINNYVSALEATYRNQQQEINDLSKDVDMWNRKYNEQFDINNELEKDLEKVFDKMKEKQVGIGGRGYYYTDLIPIEDILHKLKKLREGK